MEVVHQRDAATLLPIIQAHVAPGAEVRTFRPVGSVYNQVSSLSNVSTYNTVKHSVTFLDPATGTPPPKGRSDTRKGKGGARGRGRSQV